MKAHPALTEEHEAFRDTMRRFVQREIAPHATAWDEAEEFPRELYRKAAAAGLLGVGFPEEYGGTPADLFMHVVLSEEIALAGSGGVHARPGDKVEAGGALVVLEAMKMEHTLAAPATLRVKSVHVVKGAQVAPGNLLMEFEAA